MKRSPEITAVVRVGVPVMNFVPLLLAQPAVEGYRCGPTGAAVPEDQATGTSLDPT
jgi:hypothetical protein